MPKKQKNILEIIRSNKLFSEILQDILPDEELVPMKQGTKKMIPALAKTDEGFKQLLNHSDEKVRTLMRAKVASKSWPSHIKRIESLIAQCRASGDLLRVPLKYYGAHTGRWSGTEKINVQNFGGRGRGAEVHLLIRKMRNMLIAPEDEILAITDSAQIEARILAWIAGQTDLTEGFKNGEDIYSVFATTLFGKKVWKPTDEEKKTPEGRVSAVRRGFGKDAILGCGYGMGANTFYERCRENDSLRPLFDSGEYDWDFINGLIKTYRRTYARIPEFWTSIERAFRFVIKYPREKVNIHIPGDEIYFKGQKLSSNRSFDPEFKFWKSGTTVHLQLPSGRVLNYRHAHFDKKGTIKYHWGTLWGGAITENVVQAIARDLLGYWILECEQRIGPVVLHSHDEIVNMVDNSTSVCRLSEMINIFCEAPDWAEGLPLAAEGQLTRCYVK